MRAADLVVGRAKSQSKRKRSSVSSAGSPTKPLTQAVGRYRIFAIVKMKSTIILIGPLGAGKTTVGQLLAEQLDMPLCSVDHVRGAYYQNVGYDDALASQIAASEQGIQGVLRYSKPFEAQMVEQVLADHHGIIDFGASNSVYDDKDLFARVENALAPYPNVILLLPSPDMEESVEILKNRLTRMLTEAGKEFSDELFELNESFVKHPSNYRLAKRVIYTKDKMPKDICDEIVQKLG
jgi:shikimate kinase